MNAQSTEIRKRIEDYSYGLKDVIGRGFSSVVYRGINQKSKEVVAIKVIDIRSIQGKPEKKMLDHEIDALKKMNHNNILKCYDIFSTVNNCYIITEFCNEGDMENLLKKRQKLSEQQAVPIIREIILGFLHIADSGYMHRDLKPANILIKDKVVKIADFGFAKRIASTSKEAINVGSPLYMSPEALTGNIYTIQNDIWSIGVMLFEVLHGKAPWNSSTEKELKEAVFKNNITLLKSLSQNLKDFIKRCLTPDEKKRLDLKEFMKHPFVAAFTLEAPMLLRKQTSNHEKTLHDRNGSTKEIKNNLPENYLSNKPKILHHKPGITSNSVDKQIQTQVYWLKFLRKFSEMFPEVDSGKHTSGLRFIVVKQYLTQMRLLSSCLEGENAFQIEGWKQFIRNQLERSKFKKALEEEKKFCEKMENQFKQWVPIIKDKKLSTVADKNFKRSQFLSMLGISYSIEQCKDMWNQIFKQRRLGGTDSDELPQKLYHLTLRLDFTMSFFQLNGFLVDYFYDLEYFSRMSRLETIMECVPASLQYGNFKDFQCKMKALELIK